MTFARFSPALLEILIAGGWFEGRRVSLPAHARDAFPKARAVLEEFCGLKVGNRGPGITMARVVIQFELRQGGPDEDLRDAERRLGKRLYCVGEMDGGHADLFIDNDGEVHYCFLDDEWHRVASTIEGALELLLLGKRPPAQQWG